MGLENAEDRATLGAVLGGMIAWDQAISNQLTDTHLDSAIKWANRFKRLYDLVERHNRDILVDDVLMRYAYERDSVETSIDHYESMKMIREEA